MYRSMNNYKEGLNVMVDLDAEQGRPVGKALNQFRLFVRPTKTVNLAVLQAWLQGRISMGEGVLEALSGLSCPLKGLEYLLTAQTSWTMFFANTQARRLWQSSALSSMKKESSRIWAMVFWPSRASIKLFVLPL